MKTAMQQLIEELNEEAFKELFKAHNYIKEYLEFRIKSTYLESEKEQITEAFHKGQVAVFEIIKSKFPQHKFEATQREVDLVESGKEINEDAEKYYQQTYNQEQ